MRNKLTSRCLIATAWAIALQLSVAAPAQISSITLERTACLGTCPIYSVTIFSDGRLQYKGEMFVKAKGIRIKRVSVADFQKLAVKVDEIEFFRLQPAYPAVKRISDAPSTFITVVRDGVGKRVEDYMAAAPKGLRELETLMDDVARISGWVELDDDAAGRELDRAWERAMRNR